MNEKIISLVEYKEKMGLEPNEKFINDEETEALICAYLERNDTITEEEALKIVNWAEETRIKNLLLEMTLDRQLSLSLVDGEIAFTAIE